jgi:hypothetical protein
MPEALARELVMFLSLDGKATADQYAVREQAFYENLGRVQGPSILRAPEAAIRAAMNDPKVKEAGLGEAVVSAGSGGGWPCGPHYGDCSNRFCNSLETCRSRYQCSGGFPANLPCLIGRTMCMIEGRQSFQECALRLGECGAIVFGTELSCYNWPAPDTCGPTVSRKWDVPVNPDGSVTFEFKIGGGRAFAPGEAVTFNLYQAGQKVFTQKLTRYDSWPPFQIVLPGKGKGFPPMPTAGKIDVKVEPSTGTSPAKEFNWWYQLDCGAGY